MIYSRQIDFFPLCKTHVLPNGFVRFIAPIARATMPEEKGYLNIGKDGKQYYQRISKEVLERSKKTFCGLPVTLNHVKSPVTSVNGKEFTRGLTGSSESSIIQIDSYQLITGTIYDEELIEAIRDRVACEISPGYRVSLSPLQGDVCEQLDRIGDHMAFVPRGRQGSSVALHLDESEIPWDFASDTAFNQDAIAELSKVISNAPHNILDLSYSPEKITIHNATGSIKMKKVSILTDSGTVLAAQFDDDQDATEFSAFLARLKQSDEIAKTCAGHDIAELIELKKQVDSAEPKDDTEAIQKAAQGLALDFMKVVPHILKLKPDFQIDSIPTVPELHMAYLCLAHPAKADQYLKMQIDESPIGVRNAIKLETLFEVEISQQNDETVTQAPSSFNQALRALLSSPAVKPEPQEDEETPKESDNLKTAREALMAAYKTK